MKDRAAMSERSADNVDGERAVLTHYVLGPAGLLERLAQGTGSLVEDVRRPSVARLERMDISDPEPPRLRCSLEALVQA
jgi:hypothetical protein